MNKITLKQARKVLEIVDQGLSNGLGKPVPGQMCVEAAVCFALGQPHGDEPECVAPSIRKFKIGLNDSAWSSNAARAKGMRAIAVAQLGSRDSIDEAAFAKALAEQTIRQIVPAALRAAASILTIEEHKNNLLTAATRCEQGGTEAASEVASWAASWAARAASEAASAASAASEAASWAASAASAASEAASWAASEAASEAASRAASAASEAASWAARAASEAASWAASAASDQVLSKASEVGSAALRSVKAPGVKLMDAIISEK